MEKRSRRRVRDLVAPPAFQGLSQNEIGCARISMMARSTNAPFKGRIQKRKTNHLQIITFGLQRTAGPYKGANRRHALGYYSISSSPRFLSPSNVFTASNSRFRSTSHGWKFELTSSTKTRSSAPR
jgi:hypothetical protein